MKSFTRTIKQGFALIAALLFVYTAHAQFTPGDGQFVVAYTFPSATTNVQFYAAGNGTVTYSFQVFNNGAPTSNSGSGSFTATTAGSVVSLALTLNAGDSIVIAFAPANLQHFYNYGESGTSSSAANLTDVLQWGSVHWSSMSYMFFHCSSLKNISATDVPDLSAATDMSFMFDNATAFNGNISNWNTTNVTNMQAMFMYASSFNQDISGWNTANVTDMSYMFMYATAFNQDISNWNTEMVTTMQYMFYHASAFNQNIGNWNTTKVTDMSYMFMNAIAFNQNIGNWNTENVTTMRSMFENASAFNQNLGSWNTANVTNMSYMFYGATVFNQDISDWNTASVTDMSYMFYRATAFNGDISDWNMASVTNMSHMFYQATAFNGNISDWNTASVTNMSDMFYQATAFNRNISGWNTENVTNMQAMFYGATSFNQNLGSWNLSSIPASSTTAMSTMLSNSGLDCTNYSLTLQGWADNLGRTTPNGIRLSTTTNGLSYNNDAAITTAHSELIADSWTITDNGSDACIVPTATPVTLLGFTAQKQGNTTLLQWQTATESNNKGFAVQRSSDGQNWQIIGFVNSKAANGNSAQPLSYQYTDNAPLSGINYYRLQQQDLDGTVGYSGVVNINFGILQPTIRPNPASTQFTVTVGANSNFQLINIGGSIILKGSLKAGDNNINVSSLADGVYVLHVVAGNSVKTYEVLIRK